ncbi:MAG TPA: metallopeptidase family protein [Bacteroidota bacterium]|jgi:predicted Zn-dependent protease with MMP-like domain|nr:metallopeptidase family protein [Bacteroidota bacterium]
MDRILFEHIVEQTFDRLPPQFKNVIENLGVVVEDYPTDDLVHKLRLRTKHDLLGLYQGIPLTARGSWYGTLPVVPDKISLYQKNIEALCTDEEQIIDKIYEVLIHEIGHYFGMSEEEIRAAGY